jgi:hypothetical protein
MVLMWGEGDTNLDLHGVQYNFTGNGDLPEKLYRQTQSERQLGVV